MESNRNWYVWFLCDSLTHHAFSMYLHCLIPLKPFSVPQERIRTYMNKVKEITDRKKAARLNKGAAARFVRNALYNPDEKDSGKKAASKKAADTQSDAPETKRAKQS